MGSMTVTIGTAIAMISVISALTLALSVQPVPDIKDCAQFCADCNTRNSLENAMFQTVAPSQIVHNIDVHNIDVHSPNVSKELMYSIIIILFVMMWPAISYRSTKCVAVICICIFLAGMVIDDHINVWNVVMSIRTTIHNRTAANSTPVVVQQNPGCAGNLVLPKSFTKKNATTVDVIFVRKHEDRDHICSCTFYGARFHDTQFALSSWLDKILSSSVQLQGEFKVDAPGFTVVGVLFAVLVSGMSVALILYISGLHNLIRFGWDLVSARQKQNSDEIMLTLLAAINENLHQVLMELPANSIDMKSVVATIQGHVQFKRDVWKIPGVNECGPNQTAHRCMGNDEFAEELCNFLVCYIAIHWACRLLVLAAVVLLVCVVPPGTYTPVVLHAFMISIE
jgi:hypothetical protein